MAEMAVGTEVRPGYAGFWRSLGAMLLDGLIVSLVSNVLGALAPQSAGWQALVALAGAAYWVLFTGLKGQTPGKMAAGIRVVGPDGDPPGVGRAVLREVLGKFVAAVVLCVGYFWMLWDSERQCWHDKIVGTHVVRG